PNPVQPFVAFQSISAFIFGRFLKPPFHKKSSSFYSTFAFSLFILPAHAFPILPFRKPDYSFCKVRLPVVSPAKDRFACYRKSSFPTHREAYFMHTPCPGYPSIWWAEK